MVTVLTVAACVLSVLALVAGLLALRTLGQLRRRLTILSRGAEQPESLLEASARHAEAAMELARKHQEITEAVAAERADLIERLQTSTASNAAAVLTARTEVRTAVDAVRGHVDGSLAQLRDHVDGSSAAVRGEFASALNHLTEQTSRGIRRVALVRYDAFDDMAGRMSFSLALLDEYGEGITISAIAGRSDTRVYAKGVTASAHGRRGKLIGAAIPGAGDLTPEEQQAVDAALAPTKAAPYPDGVPVARTGDDALSAAAS